nr:uncharacterized protein LOC123494481 [Aegilops tauschii subsp. strangulata]
MTKKAVRLILSCSLAAVLVACYINALDEITLFVTPAQLREDAYAVQSNEHGIAARDRGAFHWELIPSVGRKLRTLAFKFLQGQEGMLMLLRHLSYLQKEGTRRSSRLAAVSTFDSFVQQGGDPPFFMSRATRTSLRMLLLIRVHVLKRVGVVFSNHSEVDFAVKPGNCVAQMIVQVNATPEVTEVEDLDTIASGGGGGGFGSTGV